MGIKIVRASQVSAARAGYLDELGSANIPADLDTVKGHTTALFAGGGLGQNIARKTLTFVGGTPNAVGDHDGEGDPADLFTVTGTVIVKIVAVCTTLLAGDTATVEVGTAAATTAIIAQTTATDIDAGDIWHDATPDAEIEALSTMREFIISDGNDIVLDCGTENVTSGVIDFYCIWSPLSADGAVAAA